MARQYNKNLTPRAQELRRNATPQENHLWYDFLTKHPLRFQRQRVIRFTNREIDQYFDSVCRMIDDVIITQLYPNRSDIDT